MPQATNLVDAYNNFVVEPLKNGAQFKEFYVERPKEAPSPVYELKDRIENAKNATKYLFLGFRGCGKSTELNRLCWLLDKNKFLVVQYSIKDELDTSDFDFKDFFASMALKLYDCAEKEHVTLEETIRQDFLDFMMKVTNISEEDVTTQRGVGISFPALVLMKLKAEAKTRDLIRKELDTKISDLIQKLNWLIADVQSKTKRLIVVVVDDLDKLTRGQQAEDFFYKNYGLLIQPNCFVVYTFPIPLAFNPYYENVRHAFDSDVILPQVPVKSKDGNNNSANIDFYKHLIKKRMELTLIDEDALNEVILNTGKISELISVMRDSTIKAYRTDAKRITKKEVDEALEKLRRVFDRTLTQAHKTRLMEIYQKKEARDVDCTDSISRDLLFSLTAVEYEDESGRWCDVNLLLTPLVEKWKQ
jgi:hypothetical protein